VYFTLLIELFWSKERILEVYLNVIEMGNGIYGIEAASYYYFKKPANKLSKLEAASISAIFPNPRKWSATKLGPSLLKKRSTVLQNMNYFENHK
jgi:monofunctional biosynthetic peptidoglycan transglycosylase